MVGFVVVVCWACEFALVWVEPFCASVCSASQLVYFVVVSSWEGGAGYFWDDVSVFALVVGSLFYLFYYFFAFF